MQFINLTNEIIIKILEYLSNDDIKNMIIALPSLKIVIKYYICWRIQLSCEVIVGNLKNNKNVLMLMEDKFIKFVDNPSTEELKLIRMLNIKFNNFSSNSSSKLKKIIKRGKENQLINVKDLTLMRGLKRIRIECSDIKIMNMIVLSLPENLIVLELIINGPIKNESLNIINSEDYKKIKSQNLKMITIINTFKKNRKLNLPSVRYIKENDKFKTEIEIRKEWSYKKVIENKSAFNILISNLIIRNNETVQNISIFGISADVILNKLVSHKFRQLKMIKLTGESIAFSLNWITQIYLNNKEGRIFMNKECSPIIVIFSKMWNDKCKVVYKNKTCLISGSGFNFFKEWSFD